MTLQFQEGSSFHGQLVRHHLLLSLPSTRYNTYLVTHLQTSVRNIYRGVRRHVCGMIGACVLLI